MHPQVDKLANNLLTFGRSHLTGRPFFILITMEFKKVKIDAEYARTLLMSNELNRSAKDDLISKYANDMKSGEWKTDTAEPIKISKNGKLIDGQHRLMAIIKSGLEIDLWIAYDLDDDVFDVIDTGKKRTGGDTLKIFNVDNAIKISASIQVYHKLKENLAINRSGFRMTALSNQDILFEYKKNPSKWQTATLKANKWYLSFSKCLTHTEICALYFYLSNISENSADSFFNQLCGVSSIENYSFHSLRKKLISDKISKESKMTSDVRKSLIIKTWNLFRRGKQVKYLSYDPDADKKINPI